MAIKATFFSGQDTVTTDKSLHQWDYGQQLEIEAPDLSPIVEVHFGCHSMDEAEVRTCSTANGVAVVEIPDKCLEQSSPITAWVFEINGTRGTTTKTIEIPVIARKKPQGSCELPQGFSDKYTQLITEVNDAVRTLTDGDVTAKYAIEAGHAAAANTAGTASTAGTAQHATTAGSAETSTVAGKVSQTRQQVYVGKCDFGVTYIPVFLTEGHSYLIDIEISPLMYRQTFLMNVDPTTSTSSMSAYGIITPNADVKYQPIYLQYAYDKLKIIVLNYDGTFYSGNVDVTISCTDLCGDSSSVLEKLTTIDDLKFGGKFKFVVSPTTVGSVSASVWKEDADGNNVKDILLVYETGLTEDYVSDPITVDAFSDGETLKYEIFGAYKVYRVV